MNDTEFLLRLSNDRRYALKSQIGTRQIGNAARQICNDCQIGNAAEIGCIRSVMKMSDL